MVRCTDVASGDTRASTGAGRGPPAIELSVIGEQRGPVTDPVLSHLLAGDGLHCSDLSVEYHLENTLDAAPTLEVALRYSRWSLRAFGPRGIDGGSRSRACKAEASSPTFAENVKGPLVKTKQRLTVPGALRTSTDSSVLKGAARLPITRYSSPSGAIAR